MKIGIIGSGSWGTSLACYLSQFSDEIIIWSNEPETVSEINRLHVNSVYLPGIALPHVLSATTDLQDIISTSEIIILAIPTKFLRSVIEKIATTLGEVIIINVAKGIEQNSLFTLSELQESLLPPKLHMYLAYLSGPSFAIEVAQKKPTAVCVASKDITIAQKIQQIFSSDVFRIYATDDVTGLLIGGAMKNVIAIAVGLANGLELGHNAEAALITRGLHEITRLGISLGAKQQTFAGLSGLGDLVLTCTANLSRNRRLGICIGSGNNLADAETNLMNGKMVAEGVNTAKAARELGLRMGVEMPITERVYQVLFKGEAPKDALKKLTGRTPKIETVA